MGKKSLCEQCGLWVNTNPQGHVFQPDGKHHLSWIKHGRRMALLIMSYKSHLGAFISPWSLTHNNRRFPYSSSPCCQKAALGSSKDFLTASSHLANNKASGNNFQAGQFEFCQRMNDILNFRMLTVQKKSAARKSKVRIRVSLCYCSRISEWVLYVQLLSFPKIGWNFLSCGP
jgi:hypothetical protein